MQKSIPPSSGSDYHHHRFRSERLSPERSPRELEPPRPAKRKSDHHSDREREDRDRDYEHERHHHHRHHRSESSSRRSSEPVTKAPSNAALAASDRKQKASVFSRISFPAEEEPAKKRKVTASSTTEPAAAAAAPSASSAHVKAVSNGYYEGRKSSAAADYESSDDERHFKRRPSRYEPSPPPQAMEWEEEGRHSRGSRERKHRWHFLYSCAGSHLRLLRSKQTL